MTLPAAGWFPDPSGTAGQRWWSGAAWTEHVREYPPPVVVPEIPAVPDAPQAAEPVDVYVPMAGIAATGTTVVQPARRPLTGRAARVENERQARKNNVFAWTGLLMAVIGFLFNPFAIPSVLAIVFASLGLARAQKLQDVGFPHTGRGTAVAGLVVGILGLGLFLVRVYLASGF